MKNGTWEKTETNTMLMPDGKYYDPNKLESYFVKESTGLDAWIQEINRVNNNAYFGVNRSNGK